MNIALISAGTFRIEHEATRITILNLAQKIKRSGHHPVIICEHRPGLKKHELLEGIPLYRVGKLGKGKKWEYFSVFERILSFPREIKKIEKNERKKFDILHGFSASPLLSLRVLLTKRKLLRGKKRKIKTLYTIKSYSKYKFDYFFYFLLNFMDLVTVPTKIMLNKMLRSGVFQKKIREVQSFIDLSKFKYLEKKEELKKKYSYENKKVIFYYGLMKERKGVDYLIQAIPAVLEKRKDVFFIFAPRNDDLEEYQEMFKKLGVNDYVQIVKEIDVVEYLNLAEMVVLPYSSMKSTEANPSCLIEAMVCKTPAISSNLPEIKEILGNSECGLLAKPKSSSSIAKKILFLLDNPDYANRLVEKAYLKSKEYDLEEVSERFIGIYERLLGQ